MRFRNLRISKQVQMWAYVIGGLALYAWGFWAGEDSQKKKQNMNVAISQPEPQKTKKKKRGVNLTGNTDSNVPEYVTPPSAPKLEDL